MAVSSKLLEPEPVSLVIEVGDYYGLATLNVKTRLMGQAM